MPKGIGYNTGRTPKVGPMYESGYKKLSSALRKKGTGKDDMAARIVDILGGVEKAKKAKGGVVGVALQMLRKKLKQGEKKNRKKKYEFLKKGGIRAGRAGKDLRAIRRKSK